MQGLLELGMELGFVRSDRQYIELLAEAGVYQSETALIDFEFGKIMQEETEAAKAAGKERPDTALIGMKALSYGQQQQSQQGTPQQGPTESTGPGGPAAEAPQASPGSVPQQ